jgi:hypothetical protein
MPIEHIVSLLTQERDKLNRAIEAARPNEAPGPSAEESAQCCHWYSRTGAEEANRQRCATQGASETHEGVLGCEEEVGQVAPPHKCNQARARNLNHGGGRHSPSRPPGGRASARSSLGCPTTLRNRYGESAKACTRSVSRIEPFAKSQPTERLVGSFCEALATPLCFLWWFF